MHTEWQLRDGITVAVYASRMTLWLLAKWHHLLRSSSRTAVKSILYPTLSLNQGPFCRDNVSPYSIEFHCLRD